MLCDRLYQVYVKVEVGAKGVCKEGNGLRLPQ